MVFQEFVIRRKGNKAKFPWMSEVNKLIEDLKKAQININKLDKEFKKRIQTQLEKLKKIDEKDSKISKLIEQWRKE